MAPADHMTAVTRGSEARRALGMHRKAIRADLGIELSPQLIALLADCGATKR